MTAPITGRHDKRLTVKRWFVLGYRAVVLGLAAAALVAACRFVLRTMNGSLESERTLTVLVPVTLVIACAYGLFLNWVVGRNWAAYVRAVRAGKDPGSYLKVLYPSRWPL